MSSVTKFANLRSSVMSPIMRRYTQTIHTLVALRWRSRLTNDEENAFFEALQDAMWHYRSIEAIQSVRDAIAKAVK